MLPGGTTSGSRSPSAVVKTSSTEPSTASISFGRTNESSSPPALKSRTSGLFAPFSSPSRKMANERRLGFFHSSSVISLPPSSNQTHGDSSSTASSGHRAI